MPNIDEQFSSLNPSLQKLFQKPENVSMQTLIATAGLKDVKVTQPLLIQALKEHGIVASVTDIAKVHIIVIQLEGGHSKGDTPGPK